MTRRRTSPQVDAPASSVPDFDDILLFRCAQHTAPPDEEENEAPSIVAPLGLPTAMLDWLAGDTTVGIGIGCATSGGLSVVGSHLRRQMITPSVQ